MNRATVIMLLSAVMIALAQPCYARNAEANPRAVTPAELNSACEVYLATGLKASITVDSVKHSNPTDAQTCFIVARVALERSGVKDGTDPRYRFCLTKEYISFGDQAQAMAAAYVEKYRRVASVSGSGLAAFEAVMVLTWPC